MRRRGRSGSRSTLVVPAAAVVDPERLASYLQGLCGTGERLAVVAPATGETVAQARASTAADVDGAEADARAAQPAWAATSAHDRAAVLEQVLEQVWRRRDELTDAVQLVTGKSRSDAFLEVFATVQVCRFYARRGAAMLRAGGRAGFLPLLSRVAVRHSPVGLVGNIAAWNYPLLFVLADAVPMLLAGNAVLTKPDLRSVPLAGAVADVLASAGLPPGLFHVLVGNDPALGEQVVDRSDHVLFTGSEAVGRQVAARAGARLVGCTLELGGKNATYVSAEADVARAAAAAVRDCFGGAGQTCTSTERVYVHADVAEPFTRAFVARVERLRLGWTTDDRVDMGSLVSPEHLARVLDHVEDARRLGARLLTGGEARPDLGPAFMSPTVLTDVPEGARCLREETFGPLVVVQVVPDDETALEQMNDTDTGLMASIWSRDVRRAQRLAARVRTGTVVVNETHVLAWASVAVPLGGLGTSGLGRRWGVEGLLAYTRTQAVLTQHGPVVSLVLDRAPGPRARLLALTLRLLDRLRLP